MQFVNVIFDSIIGLGKTSCFLNELILPEVTEQSANQKDLPIPSFLSQKWVYPRPSSLYSITEQVIIIIIICVRYTVFVNV